MTFLRSSIGLFAIACSLASCTGGEEDTATATTSEATLTELIAGSGAPNEDIGFVINAPNKGLYASGTPYLSYLRGTAPSTANTLSSNVAPWTSKGCALTVSSTTAYTSAADQYCFIDAYEYDLFYQGLALQYNIPPSACEYVGVSFPYYYTYPVKTGPAAVGKTTVDGSITARIHHDGSSPVCIYDFSKKDSTAPNCCLGSYTGQEITTTTTPFTPPAAAPSPPTTTTAVAVSGSWGGKISNCISGPATILSPKDSNGIPTESIAYVSGTGSIGEIKVPSPMSRGKKSNIWMSNHYTHASVSSETTHHRAFDSDTAATGVDAKSNIVAAADVAAYNTGAGTATDYTTAAAAAQPYYEFNCYDRQFEIKARIRLIVRSWDYRTNVIGTAANWSSSSDSETAFPSLKHDKSTFHDFKVQINGPTSFSEGYPMSNE